jgi:hypothetical protein
MTLRQRFNDFIDDYNRNIRIYNNEMPKIHARLDRLEAKLETPPEPPKPEKLHLFRIHFRDRHQPWQAIKATGWNTRGFFYSFTGANGETVLTVRAEEVLSIRDEGEAV